MTYFKGNSIKVGPPLLSTQTVCINIQENCFSTDFKGIPPTNPVTISICIEDVCRTQSCYCQLWHKVSVYLPIMAN